MLGGHTRRLFLINSDVRKNKQSADPANYALFYLILRRGVGGSGGVMEYEYEGKEGDRGGKGLPVEPMPHCCWGRR